MLVDEARARLVARGERHRALESGDLLCVEQVAVFVAVLDFLFRDAASWGRDGAAGDENVFARVFGDRGRGAVFCLRGCGGRAAAGEGGGEFVLLVLWFC